MKCYGIKQRNQLFLRCSSIENELTILCYSVYTITII